MTMLRCAAMRSSPGYVVRLRLLPDNSWAKQGRETRPSRHSGRYAVSNQGAPLAPLRISRFRVWSFGPSRNDARIQSKALPMSKGLIDLISILDLEQLEVNLFRGNSPK